MARLLGIDATKTVVRVALVRSAYRGLTIEAFGEAYVQEGGTEADALRAAVGSLKPDGVAIAVSGEHTLYRRVELPAAAQKELASVLPFELESLVPFDMSDAVWDYKLLKRDPASPMLSVFAAVARSEPVRKRITLTRDALGQEPERVSTGPLPLVNLTAIFPGLESPTGSTSNGPVALLDLGEHTSDVAIVASGEAIFARTISRGTAGLPASAPALARELRQTLAAFRTQGGAPLTGVYVVGGGSSASGVESFLATELGVPILPLPASSAPGMTAEQVLALPRFAKALGLACGLATRSRGLDLRRGALSTERRYPFLREKTPLLAGLAAVIAVSVGFSVLAEIRTLNAARDGLVEDLAVVTRDVFGEEIRDPEVARTQLEPGASANEDDPMPRVDAFDVMVALSKAVPNEIVHDIVELDVNRGRVVIQATVPTNKDAETIADKMKENRCFKDVKIARTSQFGDAKQKYVLEFDLKCEDKKRKGAEPAPGASAAPSAKGDDVKMDGGR